MIISNGTMAWHALLEHKTEVLITGEAMALTPQAQAAQAAQTHQLRVAGRVASSSAQRVGSEPPPASPLYRRSSEDLSESSGEQETVQQGISVKGRPLQFSPGRTACSEGGDAVVEELAVRGGPSRCSSTSDLETRGIWRLAPKRRLRQMQLAPLPGSPPAAAKPKLITLVS